MRQDGRREGRTSCREAGEAHVRGCPCPGASGWALPVRFGAFQVRRAAVMEVAGAVRASWSAAVRSVCGPRGSGCADRESVLHGTGGLSPGREGPGERHRFPKGAARYRFPGERGRISARDASWRRTCLAVRLAEWKWSLPGYGWLGWGSTLPEGIAGARGRPPTGDGPAFRCRSPTAREGSGPRPRATCLWTRAGPGRGRVLECRIVPSPQEPSPWT